jgi:hypothetical protein
VNGEVFAMVGGTPEHARLQVRLGHLLTAALAGRPCEPFSAVDMSALAVSVRIDDLYARALAG